MNKISFIACLIFVVLISGCTSQRTETQPVTTNAIEIRDFSFNPDTISVAKGTTVTWTNKDSASHTVAAVNKEFTSKTLNQDDTFSYTFNDVKTIEYVCGIHPSMRGKVIVK